MPTITIDNIPYDLDSFSAEAKGQLQMLQITEQEVNRLQVQLAIAKTARNAYGKALKTLLPAPQQNSLLTDENLKVS